MNQEIIDAIVKDIGPLKITVDCELIDHVYYLVVDGNGTYPDAGQWAVKWGMEFQDLVLVFLHKHIHKALAQQDVEVISGAKVRVKLGSILDFVKER